jgi:hypothetical protein
VGHGMFSHRRWVLGAVVTALILAGLALVKLNQSTSANAQESEASNPVHTDINISGPYLQNLTQDPHSPKSAIRCGEPELAQDSLRPATMFMSCENSAGLNYQTPAPGSVLTFSYFDPTKTKTVDPCRTFVSNDGGNSWNIVNPAPDLSDVSNNCGDPMAGSGPHGELYLAGDSVHTPADGKLGPTYQLFAGAAPDEPLGISFTRSLDGGKTWSEPSLIPTANDRPWMTVDQSTGDIYEVSGCIVYDPTTKIGPYGCTPTSRNLAVSTDQGRTWTPSVNLRNTAPPTTTLTPGRLHNIAIGPESEAAVDLAAAAQGVFAAVGRTDAKTIGFEYSTDKGTTFTQHSVPLGSLASCPVPEAGGIAGDPNHRGTFAVLVACPPNARSLAVYVTHDLGATWTETADLGSIPPPDYHGNPSPFGISRPWIAYGPTGALGVMWRQLYGVGPVDDLFGTPTSGPYDVFVAISTDGGSTFGKTLRVNTAASPPADPRVTYFDDTSYILLDKHFAYVAWGDWRSGELETWLRKVPISSRW